MPKIIYIIFTEVHNLKFPKNEVHKHCNSTANKYKDLQSATIMPQRSLQNNGCTSAICKFMQA